MGEGGEDLRGEGGVGYRLCLENGDTLVQHWKAEIATLVYVKQALADADKRSLYPHHFPKVPADLSELRECERALGFRLEPDHATFLLSANGWDGFLQTTDLFGTHDFLGSDRYRAAASLLADYETRAFADTGVSKDVLFPIDASQLDGDIFAMVKSNLSAPSQVFWFAGYEIDRYPSFSEFFIAMIDHNKLAFQKLQQSIFRR
jgi:hypothetical protein